MAREIQLLDQFGKPFTNANPLPILQNIGGNPIGSSNPVPSNIVQIGSIATQMANSDNVTPTNIQEIAIGGYNSGGNAIDRIRTIAGLIDGVTFGILANGDIAFNGTTWDRTRNNLDNIADISATGVTTTQTSADLISYNHKGVFVFLNISAITAGSVQVVVNVKDPVTLLYSQIFAATAKATTGNIVYVIYPGETVVAGTDISSPISRTFQIQAVVVTGPTSFVVSHALTL